MATVDTTGGTTLPRNNGATIVYGGNIDNSGTVTNAPSTTIFGRPKTARGHNMPVGPTEDYVTVSGDDGFPATIGTARAHQDQTGQDGWGGIFAYNPPANAPPGGRIIAMRVTTTLNAPGGSWRKAATIGLGTTRGGGSAGSMVLTSGGRSHGQYNDEAVGDSRSHVQCHGIGAAADDDPSSAPLPYANPTQIHFKEDTRALGVNTWDYVTGAITKGGTAGDRVYYQAADSTNCPTHDSSRISSAARVNPTDRAARAKTNGGVGGWDVHPGRVTYNHGGYLPLSTYYNGVTWRSPRVGN